MRIISILIIFMVVGVIGHKQFSLGTIDCENPPMPHVTVNLDKREPQLDNTRTVAAITAMYRGHKGHAALPSNNFAPAITQTDINASLAFETPKKRASISGNYCFMPGDVAVNVTLDQTVFIARSAYKDRCRYDAAMDHEIKHLFVGQEVAQRNLDRFKRNIEDAFLYFLKNYGGGRFDAKTASALEQELGSYTQAAIDLSIHETMADLGQMQTYVDTPEEYRRIGTMCSWR